MAAFLISSEYSLSLTHSHISFPLSFFFYVPSEPHAHGYARLKIWNQCDQNGCYGRAPVYRTVSVRPGAGPEERKKYEKKFFLTIALRARVCHEIASLSDVVENECL